MRAGLAPLALLALWMCAGPAVGQRAGELGQSNTAQRVLCGVRALPRRLPRLCLELTPHSAISLQERTAPRASRASTARRA